jgi:hypothetical protein
MKLCGAVLLAVLAASQGVKQGAPQTQTGSIEFVASVRPSVGRAEPVLRLPFYLLRKSFADIGKEAERAEPQAELERFVGAREVSPELKAWLMRTRCLQLTSRDCARQIRVNDLLDVPEFLEAYLALNSGDISLALPSPKYRERDRTENPEKYERQRRQYLNQLRRFIENNPGSKEGMELHLANIDPGLRWAQQEAERRRRVRNRRLELAETRYLLAKTETDLAGRAGFIQVPPGEYWLSTLDGEATAGDTRLRWDLSVVVSAGQLTRLELSNANAVHSDGPVR